MPSELKTVTRKQIEEASVLRPWRRSEHLDSGKLKPWRKTDSKDDMPVTLTPRKKEEKEVLEPETHYTSQTYIETFASDDFEHIRNHPPYPYCYSFLIDTTYLKIKATSNGNVALVTIGNYSTGRMQFFFKFVNTVLVGKPRTNFISMATKDPAGNPNGLYGNDIIVTPGLSNRFNSVDAYKNIAIKNLGETSIFVSHLHYKLNDIDVLDQDISIQIWPGKTLYIDDYIKDYCANRALVYTGRILSDIIKVATQELGNAWDPKYGGPWVYNIIQEEGKYSFVWQLNPVNWCSEFVSWVYRQVYHDPRIPVGGIYCEDLYDYFTNYGDFIGPSVGDLYSAIKQVRQGAWVSVKEGGHSALFIGWVDKDGIRTTVLDPDKNFFAEIGGNQTNRVTIIGNYIVINASTGGEINWWNTHAFTPGGDTECREGFGIK